MGFLDAILTFSGIVAVPYISPGIVPGVVLTFGFELMGEMVMTYMVPFFLNWIVNFASDYYYYWSNCKDTQTASLQSIAIAAMIPGLISGIFGFVLNFVPILKAPFLLFAIGGGMWMVDIIINIIGNYGLASGITWASRASYLTNSCTKGKNDDKKNDKKDDKKE